MKRYIIILAVICTCLHACKIESADKPTRERYNAERYIYETTEGRVIFPMAMMETAFNIEAYENATAEEKVQMTYIFNCLLHEGNGYFMKNFFSFHLTPDGRSVYEPGALWKIYAHNTIILTSYDTSLTLECVDDGVWTMTAEHDKGKTEFKITQLPEEDTLFHWDIEISGEIVSGEGRVMKIYTPEHVVRRVCVNKWGCTTCMEGTVCIDVYDKDSVTLLDAFVHTFDGKEIENQYYQL